MDSDIIVRMRAEEADLSRKLKAVRDLLAAYGQEVGSANVTLPIAATIAKRTPPRVGAAASRDKVGIDGFGNYGRGIVATSMLAMLMSPSPVKTREIVAFLESMKIQISGENKVNAVGALLSRSADIVSHGKTGWTLADEVRAREIVSEHAHQENAPPSEFDELLGGADIALAAQEGGPQE